MCSHPDLVALFRAQLHGKHVATVACPLPSTPAPLTWLHAANGTFLRGANPSRVVCVRVSDQGSGRSDLALTSGASWPGYGERLPGWILQRVLAHARTAVDRRGRPVEQQYWVTDRGAGLTVVRPPQLATAVTVITPRLDLPVLCDIHSHHRMAAYFSRTDDRDDALQLGVAVVIGSLFTTPTIRVRFTVYGSTEEVPATTVFSDLGPFQDALGGADDESR